MKNLWSDLKAWWDIYAMPLFTGPKEFEIPEMSTEEMEELFAATEKEEWDD